MADQTADLVLRGGRIATVDPTRPFVTALAVRGGRIVARGGDGEMEGWLGPRTRVVELRGRAVTPGFQDAHTHPVHAGVDHMRCDLTEADGAAACLRAIARYAAGHPDLEWIRGTGWSMGDFPSGTPHRRPLDEIVPDRPVYLSNRDGHGAWVNSRALELAGITAETDDPPNGRIERDEDGRPSGTLQESAKDLVRRLLPPDTPDELEAGLMWAQAHLHRLGITGWQDASVRPEHEEAAYRTLAADERLTARVVGSLLWDEYTPSTEVVNAAADLAERAKPVVGRYRARSVKLFVDGVIENRTASMLEPYRESGGGAGTDHGYRLFEPALLASVVTALDALRLQPHFHAIGDRAVRDALDAVEAARRANGPSDTRPHIAHIQVVDPTDVPRFGRLGVTANAQAYWAVHESQMDVLTIPLLGERWRHQYPFRSLLAAGARLAMGSDWSVSTPDPLLQMEVAVTRVSDDQRNLRAPFLPEESLSLEQALTAFTLGSAWVNHLDGETGSLEIGKAADLVVLDRDLFDRTAGPIGAARVVATFVAGVPVYESPDLDE